MKRLQCDCYRLLAELVINKIGTPQCDMEAGPSNLRGYGSTIAGCTLTFHAILNLIREILQKMRLATDK